MKKFNFTVFFLLLFTALLNAQPFKYGWLTDVHIGSPNSEEYLENAINDINKRNDIEFVIVSGDIAEKGMDNELERSKKILDKLKVKYYIIPGNHDTKWSESGCSRFKELWGDDKFNFEFNGTRFIGMNSGIPWRGGGGHFASEDISWLDSTLNTLKDNQELIFYAHHPLDSEVDNWFKVTNLLGTRNTKAVLVGHGHVNKIMDFNGIPAAMGRSSLGSAKKSWGYTLVDDQKDSLFFYEVNQDSIPKLWGVISKLNKAQIAKVDSTQFINNGAEILWQKDLKTTLSASILCYQDKLYTSSMSGIVSCFDSTGKKLWEFNTNGTICSRPVVADNILAVGTIHGDLFTLDASKGTILQTVGVGENITSQLITIDYKGDKYLIDGSKPGASIVIGTASGKMLCYDIHSLDILWENSNAKGMIETKPLFVENKLVYGSWDGFLYCIDARSGILIWKWSGNKNFYYSPAACTPVTDGKYVYVTTPDKFTASIDLLLGKMRWRKENFPGWESIGISNDHKRLFIKGFTDKFFIVSPDNAKIIKDINIKFGLDTTPNIPIEYNNNILFGSKDGYIYLIRPDYSFQPLIFTGTARVLSIQHVKDNVFAASNMDGKVIVFVIK
ncbi:MAG: PQQ-binding-like beta-propeller repeat protein [Bacteroidota bacterium]|nr:PQQ-binding-like beta-propeller repeat protein [Bacteroidota bacterium]MDP4196093.1 PQQ-binding-like beta-propeller repeat protein [Bacteroidota bacterium]